MLSWLAQRNPTAVFLAGLVFVLVALFAPGVVGGALLLLLAAALAALAVTTWSATAPGAGRYASREQAPSQRSAWAIRVLRIAVPLLLVVAAFSKMI